MLNQPRITVGGQEVVASGVVTAQNLRQPIEIYPFPGWQFFIRLSFESEANATPQVFSTTQLGQNGFDLKFVNFDNPLGASTSNPIWVANSQGFKHYLNVASHLIGQGDASSRIVYFTLYRGEPV
jgi:hypothetical protein